MADFPYAGSISAGTHRPEDLIPAFLAVLCDLCWDENRQMRKDANGVQLEGYDKIIAEWDVDNLDYSVQEGENDVGFLLDELFDALEACAPEGYCFGAHPDDGADFGFWEAER